MRFQSKYRNYTLIVKPTRWEIFGGQGRQLVPGLRAEFSGTQRIFDSEKAQRQHAWSDEDRNAVEDFILTHPKFGSGIYLAPGQKMPEDKVGIARVTNKNEKRFCREIAISEATGEVVQCANEPSVGRDYCAEHDPETVRISKGLRASNT